MSAGRRRDEVQRIRPNCEFGMIAAKYCNEIKPGLIFHLEPDIA